jgi:uncharacterized Fe-S cluster protein YjdI
MAITIFEGRQISVSFDADVCRHHGAGVRALPAVFNVNRTPWIDPNQADIEQVKRAVAGCATGALKVLPRSDATAS